MIKTNIDSSKGRTPPSWLERGDDELEGRVLQLPNRDEVSVSIQEQLVVELCSK
jgi:small subunit ribosomal protein S4